MSEENQNEDREARLIEQKNILQKAQSFAKSMVSRGLDNKRAIPEVKQLRELSCHGDGESLKPCSQRKPSVNYDGSFFCGACGCGDKKGTQLVELMIDGQQNYGKLDYPTVWCPLLMPGFQPYKPSIEEPEEVRNLRKVEIENRTSIEYVKDISNIAAPPVPENQQETNKRLPRTKKELP